MHQRHLDKIKADKNKLVEEENKRIAVSSKGMRSSHWCWEPLGNRKTFTGPIVRYSSSCLGVGPSRQTWSTRSILHRTDDWLCKVHRWQWILGYWKCLEPSEPVGEHARLFQRLRGSMPTKSVNRGNFFFSSSHFNTIWTIKRGGNSCSPTRPIFVEQWPLHWIPWEIRPFSTKRKRR